MKPVLEADDGLPPGEEPRHLHGVLHRLRAAVDEEGALVVGAGRDPVEALRQVDVGLVGRDRKAHVREPVELGAHRLDDARVPVAGVDDPDAAAEIDEPVAVRVGEDGAFGVDHGDRRDRRDAARHGLGAAGQERPALGAGDFGLQADDARHGSLERAGKWRAERRLRSNGGVFRSATPPSFSAVRFGCRIVPEGFSLQPSLYILKECRPMTWRRSRLSGPLALALAALAAACGGGEKPAAGPAAKAQKISITPTKDARADASTYLKQLCPKPIGGELNFMVWEGLHRHAVHQTVRGRLRRQGERDLHGVERRPRGQAPRRRRGDDRPDLALERRGHRDHRRRSRVAARRVAHPQLRRPQRGLPQPQGGPEGHHRVRAALGVRAESADLRQQQGDQGAGLVGRALGQEVPGQALAPGRHRHALHGGAVPRPRRSERSEQALQPERRGPGQGQGQDARAPAQRPEVLGHRGRHDPAVPGRRGRDGRRLAAHDQPAPAGQVPRGRDDPEGRHHRLGRPLGAHQGRQEPRRGLRLARVLGAAVHPEAAVRRDRVHRGQPEGQGLHDATTRPRASATSATTAARSTSGSGARAGRSTRRSGTR